MEEKRVVIIATHAGEDPERATFPFVMGNASYAMDEEATIVLQGDGVRIATPGFAEAMPAGGGFPPLKKLLDDFMEQGGKMWVCGPCIKHRGIEESELIDGAEVTAAGSVNLAALEANAVFVF